MIDGGLTMLLFVGIISGLAIGIFFYMCELLSQLPVYTLLMNVDYFPIIGEWEHPPVIEFIYHMIVSIILVCLLFFFLRLWNLERHIWAYVSISSLIGLLIYPTTILSDRTPAIDELGGWLIWLVGHVIYGFVVGILMKLLITMREHRN